MVEENGVITNVRVLRGIGGGCDEEALRVVNLMPPWVSGYQRGKAVRVQFNLPIRFVLQGLPSDKEEPKIRLIHIEGKKIKKLP